MRKLKYWAIGVMTIGMVACSKEKAGFSLTGTVEGAVDGDTIFLKELIDEELSSVDTTIVQNGTFTLEGVQDSTVIRYLLWKVNGEELLTDLFLENGVIKAQLGRNESSVTGTPCNDAYQEITNQLNSLKRQIDAIYETVMGNTAISDEEKASQLQAAQKLMDQMEQIRLTGISENITNPVGFYLFSRCYYFIDPKACEKLLKQLPEKYQNDKRFIQIKEVTENRNKPITDQIFEESTMETPDEK